MSSEFLLLSRQIRSEVGSLLEAQGFGDKLTVTRGPAVQGGGSTTHTVHFSVQPLDASNAGDLLLEAGENAGDRNPQDFVCAGDADVAKNDLITYDGAYWRIMSLNGSPLGGIAPVLHCFAVAERAI